VTSLNHVLVGTLWLALTDSGEGGKAARYIIFCFMFMPAFERIDAGSLRRWDKEGHIRQSHFGLAACVCLGLMVPEGLSWLGLVTCIISGAFLITITEMLLSPYR